MSGRLGRLIAALALAAIGCGGHGGAPTHPNQDAATTFDAPDAAADGLDARVDRTGPEVTCGDAATKKATGQACGCASECSSNFCVDGVCCGTACAESCKTCAAPGSPGTCTFAIAGGKPRDATACASADPSTCGFDGTCDGAGACRRFVAGTICKNGTCSGDAVVGAFACDGAGRCKPGPTTICAPYSCDATKGACFGACALSSQCVAGQQCVNASCGKKMKGASCAKNADCASAFCADGVCCNVACQGGCVSCALPDRLGTCWPIDQGVADPRGVCGDQGAASCGSTGTCDGFGGCLKYAPETVCIAASCSGTRRNTPGTCDGLGACRPQGVQNCSPFLCAAGACTQACTSDGDCDVGHACVNGQCGQKNLGQPCGADVECLSGICVEGVCCDDACGGACHSCALASSMGHCTPLAAGAVDSKGVCVDEGATTCGTNGRCDGSSGCQKYKPGTVCAPETCAGNVYTPASTCSATGQCAPPDSLPCAPYTCNGNACFDACTVDQNCVSPNTCNSNSCGQKMRGASCSDPTTCLSGFCAQGVCCDTACAGSCTSCALSGALGTCTNVPSDAQDPAGLCADEGAASCGTNGKCEAGACERYAPGTSCEDSTCPGGTTMFTPGSTCDGQGACVTPASSSCFPFQCGVTVCNASCTTDAECAAPAVCTNGSCGLKDVGKTCADGTECHSGFCAQGVCCDGACAGTCQSCVLSGSLGHCSNIADGGTDPRGRCADQGAASCGTDGACDGKGACRLYAAGTACMAATCPSGASTLTQVRICDGEGACGAATTQPCAPYLCNGISGCKAACTVDADCLLPDICDQQTGLCGNKRRLGQSCAMSSDCLTGNYCVDGVCCSTSLCGLCQTCASGTCANVAVGLPEPHLGCAANPPCGNTGNCNGGGGCQQAGTSVACGAASCAGTIFTPLSHCTGGGACAAATTSTCSPYVCGASACKTVCATDGDCIAPFTCQGAGATRSCALKANGLACATFTQCISGNCVDGVCCGSASCLPCTACAAGTGACTPLAAGTTAPTTFCTDQGAAACATDGKCDGGGHCEKYPNGTTCSSPTCPTGATSLTSAGACLTGVCTPGAPVSCNGFKCTGAATCPATCVHDTDCAGGYYCAGGVCTPQTGPSGACTADDQCATGHCTDGVCCDSAACGGCAACNVTGSAGSCANYAQGTDPKNACADQGAATCGTDGVCDGHGACEAYAPGTTCAPPSCPAMSSTLTTAGTCSGGACAQTTTTSCGAFMCNGTTACRTTCASDGDCSTGSFCAGLPVGACTGKLAVGATCTGNDQCANNNCLDGVCCGQPACPSCTVCAPVTGACTPVAAGTTPVPSTFCADEGAASCGTDGTCNGAGGCRKYPDLTTCSNPICTTGALSLTTAGACVSGVCTPGAPSSCNGFKCAGGATCPTACLHDTDCAGGYYCAGGACTMQTGPSGACTADDQCGTGHCTDGVCCDSAACGGCAACNVLGSAGTCTDYAQGTDPKNACADQGAATCGTDGVCDGHGACEAYAPGTSCGAPPSCPGGQSILTSDACASGACTPSTSDCAPYNCDGVSACLGGCGGDGDCSTGNYCAGGACLPKPQLAVGAACTQNDDCANSQCVDGFCCGASSCGPCLSCGVATFEGACHANAAAAGAVCAPPSCDAVMNQQAAASTCDAAGTCVPGATTSCGLYACMTDLSACNTTCATDLDCSTSNCDLGTLMCEM
ncbi:MAG TPA: hypothetical protein VLA14_09700 [Polyangia bacterium]|nr:hypothetical protein [Polyangia bacterium]